jgi:diaminopimelate decarboxylase
MTDRLTEIAAALRLAARRFGTPVAVTDVRELVAAAEGVRNAFPDPWLRAYSLKANDVAAIVARVTDLGFDANVVTRGEWAVATRAGVPDDRITIEGAGKSDADLRAAVHAARDGHPPRWLAIESADEAAALVALAGRGIGDGSLDVLFRLNPEVTPETHEGLAVGAGGSKFGMTADELTAAIEVVAAAPGLVPRGIHLHVGSQLRAVDAWRDGTRRALAILALVRGARPAFDTLDLGGGFPVLPAGEAGPDAARFARELPALLAAIPAERRPVRLAIEPGRALVARAGLLVGRVLHIRDRGGRQVVLDAGMTELIRPALYGAHHDIVALTSLGRPVRGPAAGGSLALAGGGPATAGLSPARVEGPICESTDHLGEHRLPPLRRGDLVAIRDAGAYGASLASTYNGRPRPPQLLLEPDGRLTVGRRRGTLAGLG